MKTALDELKEQLIVEWDKADEAMKEKVRADHDAVPSFKEVGMKAHREAMDKWYSKYNYTEQELMYKSSEEIHEANIKAADKIVANLVQRVEKKIGKIISWDGVHTNPDNEGLVVLNGWFKGENGSCEVQSIRAGGYNIQKRHIRVLVK